MRRKITWLMAVGLMILAVGLNLWHLAELYSANLDFQFVFLQLLFMSMMTTMVVILGIFYRYPYMDERDTVFFGHADRYKVRLKAVVDDEVMGEVVSASVSGVLFKSEGELKFDQDSKKARLTIEGLNLKSVPVEVMGGEGNTYRIKFGWLGFGTFKKLKRMLTSSDTGDGEDKSSAPPAKE